MAKTDNLTDFLTDIADAIREKKGTTGAINPQDFSSEIASIESGGGADDVHNFTGEIIDEDAVGIANFKTVIVKEGVTKVLDYAFNAFSELTYVYIPDTVTSVGTNVFYNCQKLESVRLSNRQTQIMANAFYNCYALASIEIPTSVFLLGTQAFRGCTSLEEIICPSSVNTLRATVFYGCTNLKKVVFEGNITTTVGATTFRDCTSLEVVDFSNCSNVIGLSNVSAFQNVPNTCKIVVPDALYDDWIVASNWSTFASQIIKKSDYDAL